MNTAETPAAVTPLVALGDADADACAGGFCAVPAAETARTSPEPGGAAE
jgi:hypothetical protein